VFLAQLTWSQVTSMCGGRYVSCEALCHEFDSSKCMYKSLGLLYFLDNVQKLPRVCFLGDYD
jgi:hypothetical protein